MAAELALTVTVDDIVYRSDDGRFCVVSSTCELDASALVIVGDLGGIARGETLSLRGRYEQHATYGRRFRVASFAPVSPRTPQGIRRYLGSGLVPGVGPALAERLVQRFGERTLEVIATQSARLREVSGIGPQRAQAIAHAVRSRAVEAETLSYLHGLGLGPALAKRLHKQYGDDCVRALRDDPYRVAEQVAGVGFRRADEIGRALGYGADDPRRASGAVLHLVGRAADDGHVYLPAGELLAQAHALTVPESAARAAIESLRERALLVQESDRVYAPPLYAAELSAARRLRALTGERAAPHGLSRALEAHAAQGSPEQRRAIEISCTQGLFVLTGGPGTGKTTTVRALCAVHRALRRRVLLCAPTGRAAKRLSEATGAEALTIHRMLEYQPRTRAFQRHAGDPLDADLVLVDEASMLDLMLGEQLLCALPPGCTLALVGDIDQLPPVGAGPLLRELLESEICPVVRLSQVFRQAERSAIVRAAHSIQRGQRPVPSPPHHSSDGDLYIVRSSTPDTISQRLLEALDRMRDRYNLDPKRDVQILSPMRKGPLGTERLNALLQHALNPAPDSQEASAPRLRPGDKVMQLRNDYEREVFNGDLGEVVGISADSVVVRVSGRDVTYPRDGLDALALAYASTIHKVQGSEFAAVIIVLHATHHVLLNRALLYTAVTRAKRLALIIGEERALTRAVGNAESSRTYSWLRTRLQEAAGPA